MNPLIGMMARQANNANPAMQMLSQFTEFKRSWTPAMAQQKVDDMLRSGQINMQQYEQARQMAEQMKSFMMRT